MDSPGKLLGESPAIVAVRQKIAQLVGHGNRSGRLPPILIQGETGTGKGLLAHLIHRDGPRRAGPFVDVNCAAIPEPLMESELFGFERGAFTDAKQAKPGLFQAAHKGTMFLDEIGLLAEGLQGKILKVIEDQVVRRLGTTRSAPVDVWVVAASSEDLEASTRAHRFRPDLYHRLSVVTLRLPPLRDRRADILVLAEHFLARASEEYGLDARTLAPDARTSLLDYPWPGNIRELRNVMERVALLTVSSVITANMLALGDTPTSGSGVSEDEGADPSLTSVIGELEKTRILDALRQTGWNVSRAAAQLGVSRDKLRYRIDKYRLQLSAAGPARPRKPSPVGEPTGPLTPAEISRPTTAIQWEHQRLAVLRVALVAPDESEVWTDFSRPLDFLIEKVHDFGGRVEEASPDGIVALFGLDRGGEAATRAAYAALAIQQAAARAARSDLPRVTGRQVIHAGRFLVGQLGGTPQIAGDSRREAWAVLDALTSHAEVGTIVVSRAAAAFLDRRFALAQLAASDADGEHAYRLAGRKGPEFRGRLTTFVGRSDELALLRSRLRTVVSGGGQAVGIVGEPGIGKSRLLFELRESLAAEPSARYVQAHCLSFGSSTPYFPLVEALRAACGLTDTDTATLAADTVRATLDELAVTADHAAPCVLDVLGMGEPDGPLAGLGSDAIRAHTFGVLRQIFVALSRRHPLILAVEDLHWIDKTSEEFLVSLVEELPSARILLVSTYRAGYRLCWLDKSYTTQMAVPPLSSDESRRLLDSVLPGPELSRKLAPLILVKAQGNPFFLEELARIVARDAGGETVVVPDTVQDVLMARIDQLPAEARRLLQIASVCGRAAGLPLLEDVWDGPGQPETHLRDLVQREFVHVRSMTDTPVCVFNHVLTQEVAYRSLSDAARRHYHERVARALSSRFPHVVDMQPELVAQHFTTAGFGAEAIVHWLRAGQQARGRSAYTEAISHLTQGLDLLATLPAGPERSEREIEFQLALGASVGPVKGFGSREVAAIYTRARTLCQEVGQSARLFNVVSGLQALHFVRDELPVAKELADQCLALAANGRDPSLSCRSSNAMGGVLLHMGDPVTAREHLQQALTFMDADATHPSRYRSSVFHPLVFALAYASWALWLAGYPDQALRASEASLSAGDRLDHPHSRAFALHYANVFDQLRRDAGGIAARAEALTVLSTEHEFPQFKALALVMGGWAAAARGDPDGAAQIRRGIAFYRETGSELGCPYFLGLLADAHARAANDTTALETLATATAVAHERHEHVWDGELHRQRGQLLLADPARDPREAEACFREAIAVARRQGTASWELRAALSLARLLDGLGRQTEAHEALSDVYRRFTEGLDTPDLRDARAFVTREAA